MNEDWMSQGLCRSLNLSFHIFFPEQGKQPQITSNAARQTCNHCPVQSECLDYALENKISYGIWGGKSRQERRKLRRLRIMTTNTTLTVDTIPPLPENPGHG